MPPRLLAIIAVILLTAAPALAADALTPAQRDAVQALVRDYIAKHPEAVLQAVRAAQEQEKDAAIRNAITANRAQLFDDPASPVGGNPKGNATIVEFFDYRCPYCKAMEPSLEALIDEDRELRIVYKEFPILGPASVYAARVALAARAQGRYDAFHRAMMATGGTIDDAVVNRVAASVGIDMGDAKTAMQGSAIDEIIQSDYALARSLAIDGTPAFIVNGKLLEGVTDVSEIKELLVKARHDAPVRRAD